MALRIDVQIGAAGEIHEFFEVWGSDFEVGADGNQRMMVDLAVAPFDGVKPAGNSGFIDKERAARRAAAEVGEAVDKLAGKVHESAGVAVVSGGHVVGEAVVPGVAVVGVVAGEDVGEGIDGDVIDVAGAVAVDFQAGAVGADAQDAAVVELQFGVVLYAGGFDAAKITGGDIDPVSYT